MDKRLDAVIGKCKVKAHILESKKDVELIINVEKNAKQNAWIGKRVGDTYKIPGYSITYQIDAIEDFPESADITPVVVPAPLKNRAFWIFQNQSYGEESREGYIFARFNGPPHWERLREAREGHIILHSYHAAVVAVSVVRDSAYPWTRYDGAHGRRVDCDYHRLRRIVSTSARIDKNAALSAGAMHQPFNSNGTGNMGYLYDMTSKLRDYCISEIIKLNPYILDEIPELRKYTIV